MRSRRLGANTLSENGVFVASALNTKVNNV